MTAAPPNALSDLLQRPTLSRRAPDYERVYDDFIRFAGGDRISDLYTVPPGFQNADYHLVIDAFDLVIELKQMNTYRSEQTVDAWFNGLIQRGRFRGAPTRPGIRLEIGPDSFLAEDWRRFYLKFRPSVTGHLDKAASQLKDTARVLPLPSDGRPRLFGAVLMNTNDFNLSTDLLHRLAECRVREKWKRGLYSHLDFVFCTGVDLAQEGRHPLHSRGMIRSAEQPQLSAALRFLFDRWVRYGAVAVGAKVSFTPGDLGGDPIRSDTLVVGKLRRLPGGLGGGGQVS